MKSGSMKAIEFRAQGVTHKFSVTPLSTVVGLAAPKKAGKAGAARAAAAAFDVASMVSRLYKMKALKMRLPSASAADIGIVNMPPAGTRLPAPRGMRAGVARPHSATVMTLVTPSLIVEGARVADLKAARNKGARILDEGYDGKTLLGVDRLDELPAILDLLTKRDVGSVTPNFLRRFTRTPLSATATDWAYARIGLARAWTITKGTPAIRVAVLDEGVDTKHPALKTAVAGERDFIGGKGNSAMPDGNDAHGTACSGTIVSRRTAAIGMAPKCSLLAARIAMDDGAGHWVFDDFATADAIDWSWRNGAAVLSNSWGGGAPSDAISRAFGRARTQGRGGKGSVVCIAAGNNQGLIDFPGDLPGYVTVGASTPNDERKTRTSSDGESWWGSNFGPTLWLLAPGVFIHTTDISGPAGYDAGNYTATFNGTSSATPHVAAAAALMLSANPKLSASDVRLLLSTTATPLAGQTARTNQLGFGRLDVGAAVAAAKAHA